MRCPKCDSENSDSAKFCKKCGTSLKKGINHENMINSMNDKSGNDNAPKYIIIALVIVVIVLAGTFAYIYGFGSNNTSDSQQHQQVQSADDDDEPAEAESSSSSQVSQASKSSPKTSSMSIRGGSFSTGSELEDKTYASIYVGPEYAGQEVILQIWYSRDGSTLNHGNMVPVTVDSSGHLEVSSADAYSKFPDFAEINLYDSSSKLLDSRSVSLSPEAGTQTF